MQILQKELAFTLGTQDPNVETIDGVEHSTTVDHIQINPEEGYTYEYVIVRQNENSEIANFYFLCLKILHKITENLNSYENIKKLDEILHII